MLKTFHKAFPSLADNQSQRAELKSSVKPAIRTPDSEIPGLGLIAVLFFAGITLPMTHAMLAGAAETQKNAAGEPKFDSDRAFEYLVQICDIGPRISDTDGMEKQQQLLSEHFTKHKAQVRFQTFDAAHPQTGRPVRLANLVVSWNPKAKERILLACHYDTRPLPDRDPNPNLARQGRFIGANDGASGVALFMELAHHMPRLKPTYGVDFIFFDAEELVYRDNDVYFVGSDHFARDYRDNPPEYKYLYGVLVDMIADKNLILYQEANSLRYAPDLTASIWKTAKKLGIKEFIAKRKHDIRDDHLPLNEIAAIPTCDIIDFDYPHWHTTRDAPAACSGASLAKVGRVLMAWLEAVPRPKEK